MCRTVVEEAKGGEVETWEMFGKSIENVSAMHMQKRHQHNQAETEAFLAMPSVENW